MENFGWTRHEPRNSIKAKKQITSNHGHKEIEHGKLKLKNSFKGKNML